MPDTTTPKSREAYMAQRRQIGHLMLEVITPDMPHAIILDALLDCFIVVAEAHPCCTLKASAALLNVSGRLQAKALDRPAGSPVH